MLCRMFLKRFSADYKKLQKHDPLDRTKDHVSDKFYNCLQANQYSLPFVKADKMYQ